METETDSLFELIFIGCELRMKKTHFFCALPSAQSKRVFVLVTKNKKTGGTMTPTLNKKN